MEPLPLNELRSIINAPNIAGTFDNDELASLQQGMMEFGNRTRDENLKIGLSLLLSCHLDKSMSDDRFAVFVATVSNILMIQNKMGDAH